jgi:hypothetical protein
MGFLFVGMSLQRIYHMDYAYMRREDSRHYGCGVRGGEDDMRTTVAA